MRLFVNIDHVATVRQARRGAHPSVAAAAHEAALGGADSITLHLREDRRHVQDADLALVRDVAGLPINFEMAATDEMVEIATAFRPTQVCLVPEKREELTTEGGLDVGRAKEPLTAAVSRLREAGIFVSLFVDPDEQALLDANEVGAEAVELHTGRYADATSDGRRAHEFQALRTAAASARQLGLRVHAGHGLDYLNTARIAVIPEIEELNIGFSIVSRAIFVGLREAVREMRDLMSRARDILTRSEL